MRLAGMYPFQTLQNFEAIGNDTCTQTSLLGIVEYFLAIMLIFLAKFKLLPLAYVLLLSFLVLSIVGQEKVKRNWRDFASGDAQLDGIIDSSLKHFDRERDVVCCCCCARELPITRGSFTTIMNIPNMLAALLTALVVGQSLRPAFWDTHAQDLWAKGWWFFPPIGWLGLPLCLCSCQVFAYVHRGMLAFRMFLEARGWCSPQNENPLFYFRRLTDLADLLNFPVLSTLTDRIRVALAARQDITRSVAEARGNSFCSRVIIGACVTLWLKVSIFGDTFEKLLENPWEFANMIFAIASTIWAIVQQLPAQWRAAWTPDDVWIDAHKDTNSMSTLRATQIGLSVAILLLGANLVRLVGVFTCTQSHSLNLTSGCLTA